MHASRAHVVRLMLAYWAAFSVPFSLLLGRTIHVAMERDEARQHQHQQPKSKEATSCTATVR